MRFPRSQEFVDQSNQPLLLKDSPHALMKLLVRTPLWLKLLDDSRELFRSPFLDSPKWSLTDVWRPQL